MGNTSTEECFLKKVSLCISNDILYSINGKAWRTHKSITVYELLVYIIIVVKLYNLQVINIITSFAFNWN